MCCILVVVSGFPFLRLPFPRNRNPFSNPFYRFFSHDAVFTHSFIEGVGEGVGVRVGVGDSDMKRGNSGHSHPHLGMHRARTSRVRCMPTLTLSTPTPSRSIVVDKSFDNDTEELNSHILNVVQFDVCLHH